MQSKCLFMICIFLLSSISMASANDNAPNFQLLSNILDQNTLLKAQLEGAKTRAEMAKTNAPEAVAPQPIGEVQTAAVNETSYSSQPQPTVEYIYGKGKALKAHMRLPDGSKIDARAGDVIYRGIKVIKIDTNRVVLRSTQGDSYAAANMPAGA